MPQISLNLKCISLWSIIHECLICIATLYNYIPRVMENFLSEKVSQVETV